MGDARRTPAFTGVQHTRLEYLGSADRVLLHQAMAVLRIPRPVQHTAADQGSPSEEAAVVARAAVGRSSGAEPGLRREVGLTALMSVSLGSIIGSGWLLGTLTAAVTASRISRSCWPSSSA